jgi:hypothetical protein
MSEVMDFNKYLIENSVKRDLNIDLLRHCPNYFGDFVKVVAYNTTTGILEMEVSNKLLLDKTVANDSHIKLKRTIYELDDRTINSAIDQLYKTSYNCILSHLRKNAISIIVTVDENLDTEIRFEHVKTEFNYVIKKNLLQRKLLNMFSVGSTWKLLLAGNTPIDKTLGHADVGAPVLSIAVNLDVENKKKG